MGPELDKNWSNLVLWYTKLFAMAAFDYHSLKEKD